MKLFRVLIVIGALATVAAAPLVAQTGVDAISAASTQNYYEESSLSGVALYDLIGSRRAAFVWSTMNANGTPNAAVLVPGVVDRNQGILAQSFGGDGPQTIVNMRRGGYSILTVYQHNPDSADRLERNTGARVVCEYISDPAQQRRLLAEFQRVNPRATAENTVFLRIVRVLPLG
ncbi:MAG: hypothetical protein EA382_15845 [Spirochaetaceae bacterium]|nr:MAG: hypothetical protein EA382_15845 [Spirochaetaceae bacterium]